MAENDVEENLDPGPVSEPGEVQQMEGVVTVVLTADNHLGYAGLSQHPRKREECRQRLRHAFQMATDFAVNQGVDLFIQAGDLFDTANPDERDRSFVAERLAQLRKASIRTFALGGVHDTPVSAHSTPIGSLLPLRLVLHAWVRSIILLHREIERLQRPQLLWNPSFLTYRVCVLASAAWQW